MNEWVVLLIAILVVFILAISNTLKITRKILEIETTRMRKTVAKMNEHFGLSFTADFMRDILRGDK